jgi:hypothetical protein
MSQLPDHFQNMIDDFVSSGNAARLLRTNGDDDICEADPLDIAEKLIGAADGSVVGLGFLLMHAKKQIWEKQAAKTNDTILQMSMKDYLAIVEQLGFKKILEVPFVSAKKEGAVDNIQYHYWRNGLLLVCDTHAWKQGEELIRNSAVLYFNLVPKDLETSVFEVAYLSGGFDFSYPDSENLTYSELCALKDRYWKAPNRNDYYTFVGQMDAKEGLRKRLRALENFCIVLSEWRTYPHLQLLHYVDYRTIREEEGQDNFHKRIFRGDEITRGRISLYPKEIQEALKPCLIKREII